MTPEEAEQFRCAGCNDTGWALREETSGQYPNGRMVAHYCTCMIGSNMKAAHAEYFRAKEGR